MKVLGYEIRLFKAAKGSNESQPKNKRQIRHRIKKNRVYYTDLEMDKLGDAIDAALETENPSREDLYSIYEQISKDLHLKSQVRTAINDVQQSQFEVRVNGNPDESLKEAFEERWFNNYLKFDTEAEFWGHSLIEFPVVNENGVFENCYLLPRENVDPERGRIILDKDSQIYLPYMDASKQVVKTLDLIEVYGEERFGIYEMAAAEVILKKYARTDWSQASERYGMPWLDYATDTEDKTELDKIEEMCKNFAANGYVIRGKDDEVEIKQPDKGDFYRIYMEAISLANQEISKLINGQTGTSDEKSFVGSAEVHERILNIFTKARLRIRQHNINDILIPFMVERNYKEASRLKDARFVFTDLLEKPRKETDPVEAPNNQPQKQPGLKKKLNKAALADTLLDGWLERFFKKKLKGIDPEIWRTNFESLLKAIKGAGIKFTDTYKYADLAAELRTNAASFAAFKNWDEQQQLFDLLVDDNGEPRSFAEFKKLARPITEKYNKGIYIETEFKQAEANAQMAVKWAGFEETADLYPNLEYRTAGDSDVRPEHARLDGVVLPLTHHFWRKNFPPNGWGCRCDATQTDKPATKKIPDFDPLKGFDFNPGIDKKLFSDSNSYQAGTSKKDAKKVVNDAGLLLDEYIKDLNS